MTIEEEKALLQQHWNKITKGLLDMSVYVTTLRYILMRHPEITDKNCGSGEREDLTLGKCANILNNIHRDMQESCNAIKDIIKNLYD